MKLKTWVKKNKEVLIIIALASVAVIIFIIPLFIYDYIETYGQVKLENDVLLFYSETTNCELDERVLKLAGNTALVQDLVNEWVLISGQLFNDTLRVTSVNPDYDQPAVCLPVHEKDVVLEFPLEYTVTPDEVSMIEYSINNIQEQKLFYESTITLFCDFERNYVTGYLEPGESMLATFLVTCAQGEYEASIYTIFVDELGGRHAVNDTVTVHSTS